MRVLRLLFISVTILFLFSNIVFSQSSIYDDAKAIAKYLEGDLAIKVRLKKGNNSNATISIIKNDKKIQKKNPDFYSFSTLGLHEIQIKNWEASDSVFISYRDSLCAIIQRDTIEFPNKKKYGKTSSSGRWHINNFSGSIIILDYSTGNSDHGYLGDSFLYEREDDNQYLNIYSLSYLLNSHANIKNLGSKKEFSLTTLHRQYAKNPFFHNLDSNKDLFPNEVDPILEYYVSENLNSSFSDYYFKNNPWSKLLYGDSILQLQKTVSFEDTNSNYRTRIVSSQKELTEASVRIDQTNKNKNLLDAKTIAVGLSDFIAERAQEELNLTFFNRFKQNMENPSELTVLFPNTKTLLYNFEISNYKTLLSHARESFTVDLDNLGLNFPKVLKLKKYEDLYNSPEVFNLSLIYSIADLAYKEVPVETILISGFQKLQERKIELKKSINIELADAFMEASNPNEIEDRKLIRSLIQKNPELDTLNQLVRNYLDALNQSRNTVENASMEFSYIQYQMFNYLRSAYDNSEEQEKILRDIDQGNSLLRASAPKFEEKFTRKIIYKNRQIKEDDNTILNYYDNIISANLQGNEFYGYLIDNPRIDDYELYLKTEPNSINEIIAQGIEESRNLMAENFEGIILDFYNTLEESQELYKTQRVNHYLAEKEKDPLKQKVVNFGKKIRLLHLAIRKEISFWENTVPNNEVNFHLSGLHFLDALLTEDIYIRLFQKLTTDVEVKDVNMNNLIQKDYRNSLGTDFNKNLLIAKTRLDSIQSDFEHKINTLEKEFGDYSMIPNSKQMKLLVTNFESDSLRILEKMRKADRIFLGNKFEIENLISDEELKDTLNIRLENSEIVYIGKSEYFNNLRRLDTDLDNLQTELQNSSNASNRDSINNEIDKLTDEKDELVEKKEMELNRIIEVLEKEKEKKRELLNKELAAIKSDFEIEKTIISSNTNNVTAALIKNEYDLMDNIYYKRFLDKKIEEDSAAAYLSEYNITESDQLFENTKKDIEELKSSSEQLQTYITFLENKYCKDIVAAEKNAKNLSTGLEIATHLLFAFRDYEKLRDTLFYEDSVFVKVTVNQLDTLSGFTNTYTSDSLRTIRKPIKGTTDELVAARWITKEEFSILRKNELEYSIFLGLLYQRLSSIENAPNFSPKGIAILATKFLSITNDMDNYRNELRRKKAINEKSISFKDYYPFIRSTVDLFNTVITVPSIGDTTTIATSFGLKNIPHISNEALSLYENIYAKNYGNAILNSMQLLRIITKEKTKNRKNKKDKREARKSQLAINAVLTYGTFMANMIKAESSDQVKNILKSATLPPGSSRIKRETVTSFTINSYLGAAVGRDRLLGIPENLDLAQDAFGASLAVPIGFTYSFSPNLIKNNSSFSIHVPLIDLGAITAYRQNPDNPNYSIDDLPDFSWNNLFSPGLFVVYNFAESPFSLGVGGQYGPQLRQITPTGGEAVNVNSWRFPMAFFTIDVPFFNLHTGARKIIVK